MDKGCEVIKIVEWNLKGQGTCFIFRSGEYKQETLYLEIQDGFI